MTNQPNNQYRVFLSYAHADAETEAGKELISQFKVQINAALQPVTKRNLVFLESESINWSDNKKINLVFLDNESLDWGDEWSTEIMKCLEQCKVFVCLLSPNYQKSTYCRRERLMWERKEIRQGRLRKGTQPIYYIRIDNEASEELLISQIERSEPFFENVEQIREDIIAEKIEHVKEISQKIKNREEQEENADSKSFGFMPISPFFVGRLVELAKICEFLANNYIPIIVGAAGVGKTELAIAYSSGYAEEYPQGRFLLHMEGINDWDTAIVKFIEDNSYTSLHDFLLLPEDFDKLSIKDKRKMVIQRFWKKAEKGKLLILLDNLDNLDLLSENGLLELWEGVENRPQNVNIIATSRYADQEGFENITVIQSEPTTRTSSIIFEIKDLDTASIFEMFCLIGKEVFKFAKLHPQNFDEFTKLEYNALISIIEYLKGPIWALEIIAAFMKKMYCQDYTFQRKLQEIKSSIEIINTQSKDNYRHSAKTLEALLDPTIDIIKKIDYDQDLGKKIIELAFLASFFQPEQISKEILVGYWIKNYGNNDFKFGRTATFALNQLIAFHILNGEYDDVNNIIYNKNNIENNHGNSIILKMHRITKQYFLSRVLADKNMALNIAKKMHDYVLEFLKETKNLTLGQFQSLLGWAGNTLDYLPYLKEDIDFLKLCNILCSKSFDIEMDQDATLMLERVQFLLKEKRNIDGNKEQIENYKTLQVYTLENSAKFHLSIGSLQDAEFEYNEALSIWHELNLLSPSQYIKELAITLANLAGVHAMNKNTFDEALYEYNQALTYLENIHDNNYEIIYEKAKIYNKLAELYHSNNGSNQKVQEYYQKATSIFSELYNKNTDTLIVEYTNIFEKYVDSLVDKNSYYFNSDLIKKYFNSDLIKKINEYYKTICQLRRKINLFNPSQNSIYLARTLSKYVFFRIKADIDYYENMKEVISDSDEALLLLRGLYAINPIKYGEDLAKILNERASRICKDDQEVIEYKQALRIYNNLHLNNPEKYKNDIYMISYRLCKIYNEQGNISEENKILINIVPLIHNLYQENANKYIKYYIETLRMLAESYKKIGNKEDAISNYEKVLELLRSTRIKTNNIEDDEENIEVLNELADLYKQINYVKVETFYLEALSIVQQKSNEISKQVLAELKSNLADLHMQSKLSIAESEYLEALSLWKELKKYKQCAHTLIKVAQIQKNKGNNEQAEIKYNEALSFLPRILSIDEDNISANEIKTKKVKRIDDIDDDECDLIFSILKSLAQIHRDSNLFPKAEEEYYEAETYLNKKYYHGDLFVRSKEQAMVKVELAELHVAMNQSYKSEIEYFHALSILQGLYTINNKEISNDLINILIKHALFFTNNNNFSNAEEECQKALKIVNNNINEKEQYLRKIKQIQKKIQRKQLVNKILSFIKILFHLK
jgi:tetratricopeptide (TPR) repeat protein